MSLSESTWHQRREDVLSAHALGNFSCYVPHPFQVCHAPKNLWRKLSWHCTNPWSSRKFSPSKVSRYIYSTCFDSLVYSVDVQAERERCHCTQTLSWSMQLLLASCEGCGLQVVQVRGSLSLYLCMRILLSSSSVTNKSGALQYWGVGLTQSVDDTNDTAHEVTGFRINLLLCLEFRLACIHNNCKAQTGMHDLSSN